MGYSDDETAVRNTLDDYLQGSYQADMPRLKSAFWPGASLNGYLDGQLVQGAVDLFFADVASKPSLESMQCDFKADIASLEIRGSVAAAVIEETGFGPYDFTDYMHLLKKDGVWKIISKTFTTK